MTLSKSIHVAENGIISFFFMISLELPWWLSGKESACKCRRPRFDPWAGKIPWRREWLPIPVFLPGETHGQRSLAGYIEFMELQRVGHEWVTNTFTLPSPAVINRVTQQGPISRCFGPSQWWQWWASPSVYRWCNSLTSQFKAASPFLHIYFQTL